MIRRSFLPLVLALSAGGALAGDGRDADMSELRYPPTERVDVIEEKFGITVADPYRWLEDDVRANPKVREWVTSQNEVTDSYLETLPGRDALAARMTELFDYARYGVPIKRGQRYFFTRNDGLQNQSVLYVRVSLARSSPPVEHRAFGKRPSVPSEIKSNSGEFTARI